jgi:hypothetical protein
MPLEWQLLMEGGQERGPLSTADLKRLADFGQLQPQALVRPVGGDWQPAGTVAELFPSPVQAAVQPQLGTPSWMGAAPTPLVPTALIPALPVAMTQPAPMAAPGAAEAQPAFGQPSLAPLPESDGLNPAVPAAILGVIVIGLGGLFLCGMIAIALIRSSLPKSPPGTTTERKPAPGRTGSLSQRGIDGRPKEDSDRFRRFAEEAGKTPWIPGENPPATAEGALQAEIDQLEQSLLTRLDGARATPTSTAVATEFDALRRDYHAERIAPQRYLRSLRTLVERLR